nr:MAG TPA: hypothetical protein [Caudoviricetes sp.]
MSVEVMGGGGSANLQSKSILPPSLPYTANPDSGYDGFSALTVQKPSALIASNIKSGVSIFGVSGTYEGDSATSAKQIVESSPSSFSQTSLTVPVPSSAKKINGISFYFSDSQGGYASPETTVAMACAVLVLEAPVSVGQTVTVPTAYEVYGGHSSNTGYALSIVENSITVAFAEGSIVVNVVKGANFGRGYYTFALGLG